MNLKQSAEQRRLMLELDAKAQLEPMLEKANQERYALEKDFHELTAKAMHAPAANVAESKALRLQVGPLVGSCCFRVALKPPGIADIVVVIGWIACLAKVPPQPAWLTIHYWWRG